MRNLLNFKSGLLSIADRRFGGGIQTGWLLLICFLSLLFVFYCWKAYALITHPFELEHGEGIILRWSLMVAEGKSLYGPLSQNPPFVGCNYPPLFMLLTALPVKLTAASYLPGRLLGVLATVGTVLVIFGMIRRLGGDPLCAAFGALLYPLTPTVSELSVTNRIDMLAVFLSTGGVYLLMPAGGSTENDSKPGKIFSMRQTAGLVFLALGTFTKQTAVFASSAYFIWLLLADRKQFLKMLLAFGGICLILHGGLTFLTGGRYYSWVVSYSAGQYSLDRFFFLLNRFLHKGYVLLLPVAAWAAVASANIFQRLSSPDGISGSLIALPTGLAGLLAKKFALNKTKLLFALYIVSLLCTLVFWGKIGSSQLYFFEIFVLLSVCAGLAVFALKRHCGSSYPKQLALLVAVGMLVLIHFFYYRAELIGLNKNTLSRLMLRDQRILRILQDAAAPYLVEDQAYAVQAAAPPYFVNPFIYSDLSRRAMWDPERIVSDLKKGNIGVVCLNSSLSRLSPMTIDRIDPQILKAVAHYYRWELKIFNRFLYFQTKQKRDQAYQRALAAG